MWTRRLIKEEARRKMRIVLASATSSDDENELPYISSISNDDIPTCSLVESHEITECHESDVQSSIGSDEANSSDFVSSSSETNENFIDELRQWAIEDNVGHNSLKNLLRILQNLRKYGLQVPLHPRTLLKSFETRRPLKNVSPGHYYHFGLRRPVEQLCDILGLHNTEIFLDINIDGVSLFRSSCTSYWVILASARCIKNSEYVVGLYYGPSKPADVYEFLEDVITDLKELARSPTINENQSVKAKLGLICCDRPARSYVKCIKSHNGYYGCDRCTIKGDWQGTLCFTEINCERRSDISFRARTQREHHKGISPFEALENVDMVNDFPQDCMHVVCCGVTMRILDYLRSGPNTCRLSTNDMKKFDCVMASLRHSVPQDFSRKPRSLQHLKLWKATELYLLTVYLSFIIFPKLFPANSAVLETLMTYCTTVFLMCSNHVVLHEELQTFLCRLNDLFPRVFTKSFCTYNVHAIVHLSEDYFRIGNIMSFSVFRFENFLRFLKKTVRSPYLPLQQAINRIHEGGQFLGHLSYSNSEEQKLKHGFVSNGQMRYRTLIFNSTILKSKSKDGYVLTKCGKVIKIAYFYRNVNRENQIFFCGRALRSLSNMFTSPIDSGRLCIFKAQNLEYASSCFNVRNIKLKMMVHHDGHFFCLPILHTYMSV